MWKGCINAKSDLLRRLNTNTPTDSTGIIFFGCGIFDLTPDGALTPTDGAVDGQQL